MPLPTHAAGSSGTEESPRVPKAAWAASPLQLMPSTLSYRRIRRLTAYSDDSSLHNGGRYKWDPTLRKYVNRDMAAAGPSGYVDEADMVYAGDDEVIPTLEAARAAEVAAEAEAEAEAKGKGKGARKRAATAMAGQDGAAGPSNGGEGAEDADVDAELDADAAELIEAAGGPSKKKKPTKVRVPSIRGGACMCACRVPGICIIFPIGITG